MNAVLKPRIDIQQEHYSEQLKAELMPLLHRNWRESGSYEEGLEVDPNWPVYEKLDKLGVCQFLTARIEGVLVGYANFFISPSLHHRTVKAGMGDALYTLPEVAGAVAVRLVRESERRLKLAGVTRMGWWSFEGSRHQKILMIMGYEGDERMMEKVL